NHFQERSYIGYLMSVILLGDLIRRLIDFIYAKTFSGTFVSCTGLCTPLPSIQ
ncbi:unnamed protein product, partial [Didymodactylos carnosus]